MGSSNSTVVAAAPPVPVPARRRLSFGKKLLFVGVLAAFGFAVIEVVARCLVPAPLEWREHPGKILQYDAVRGWVLRPSAEDFTVDKPVKINAAGFRDRDFSLARTPDVPRIACVGDSYTYGWGVPVEESFPKQLEARLSRKKTTEVLNLGVFGYNAPQVQATIETQALPYKPDLILYAFYWDDLLPARTENLKAETFEEQVGGVGQRSWARRMLRHSRALFFGVDQARALKALLAPPKTRFYECFRSILAGEDAVTQDLWQAEARSIRAMRDDAKKIGARFAVVLWPLESQVLSHVPTCHFQQTAQKLCDTAGVPMISMLEPLQSVVKDKQNPYLPFEQHPTGEGYRRCSETIASFIEERKLLDGPQK